MLQQPYCTFHKGTKELCTGSTRVKVIACQYKKRQGKYASNAACHLQVNTTQLAQQTGMPLGDDLTMSLAMWVPEGVVPSALRRMALAPAIGQAGKKRSCTEGQDDLSAGPSTMKRRETRAGTMSVEQGEAHLEGDKGKCRDPESQSEVVDLTNGSDVGSLIEEGGRVGMRIIIDLTEED